LKKQHVIALALGAGLVFAGTSLASAKPESFDGTWKVRLVTESGTCDSSYSQTVAIENGRVRPLAGGATAVSGGVGSNGTVALTISRSLAEANASGRLNAQSGSGNWKLAMLGCTGRWTASRA
jgi:hypothetical protein